MALSPIASLRSFEKLHATDFAAILPRVCLMNSFNGCVQAFLFSGRTPRWFSRAATMRLHGRIRKLVDANDIWCAWRNGITVEIPSL